MLKLVEVQVVREEATEHAFGRNPKEEVSQMEPAVTITMKNFIIALDIEAGATVEAFIDELDVLCQKYAIDGAMFNFTFDTREIDLWSLHRKGVLP
jgi:hypothetical protein